MFNSYDLAVHRKNFQWKTFRGDLLHVTSVDKTLGPLVVVFFQASLTQFKFTYVTANIILHLIHFRSSAYMIHFIYIISPFISFTETYEPRIDLLPTSVASMLSLLEHRSKSC